LHVIHAVQTPPSGDKTMSLTVKKAYYYTRPSTCQESFEGASRVINLLRKRMTRLNFAPVVLTEAAPSASIRGYVVVTNEQLDSAHVDAVFSVLITALFLLIMADVDLLFDHTCQ
jgi:hypothetical protein